MKRINWTFSFLNLSWTPELYQSWKLFSWAYYLFCSCLSMYRFQLGPTENHWNVVRNADPGVSLSWPEVHILLWELLFSRDFQPALQAKKTMKNTQTLVYLYKLTVYKLLEWTAAAGRILVIPTKSKVKLLLAEKGIALSAWRCFLNFCTQAWQWIRREIRR